MSFLPDTREGDGFTMVVASKRRSGKSVMIRFLLYQMFAMNKGFDRIHLFSETATIARSSEWKNILSPDLMSPLDDEKLGQIMDLQKTNTEGTYLLIFDDCLGAESFQTCKNLNEIATHGRHFGISMIVSVQYPKFILTTSIRNNTDFLLMSKNSRPVNKVLKEMVVWSGDDPSWFTMLANNTDGYSFVLYDNTLANPSFKKITAKMVPKDFFISLKPKAKKKPKAKPKAKSESSKSSK